MIQRKKNHTPCGEIQKEKEWTKELIVIYIRRPGDDRLETSFFLFFSFEIFLLVCKYIISSLQHFTYLPLLAPSQINVYFLICYFNTYMYVCVYKYINKTHWVIIWCCMYVYGIRTYHLVLAGQWGVSHSWENLVRFFFLSLSQQLLVSSVSLFRAGTLWDFLHQY